MVEAAFLPELFLVGHTLIYFIWMGKCVSDGTGNTFESSILRCGIPDIRGRLLAHLLRRLARLGSIEK